MPGRTYKTVGTDLVEYADRLFDHLEGLGYRVRLEYDELGYPFTPTFVCERKPTRVLVEISAKIERSRVEAWVRYAKSTGKDTRFAVGLPHQAVPDGGEIARLGEQDVGLYSIGEDRINELLPPGDLGLNVALPDANSLPNKLRVLLGSAYEQFGRQQWREGFEDACQALEVEARKYLAKWSKTGRIQIIDKNGNARTLTKTEINKMTMGQLAKTFNNIQAQNLNDSVIAKALNRLNQDRVGVVHHKKKALTEKRLRANVGQHMWVIVAALKKAQ